MPRGIKITAKRDYCSENNFRFNNLLMFSPKKLLQSIGIDAAFYYDCRANYFSSYLHLQPFIFYAPALPNKYFRQILNAF